MSKWLALKNALRTARWEAAQDCVAQTPDLLLKEDAKGRSLAGYAAQDGRWEELRWMLDRGASKIQAAHGWLRHGEAAPLDLESLLFAVCAEDQATSARVGGESLLEAALHGGRLDMAAHFARKPWVGDEAGWRRAWFCAIRRFDPRICMALAEAKAPEWTHWLDELAVSALRQGRLDALIWLRTRGLDWDGVDCSKTTLLGKAATANQADAIVWMLEGGAKVDALDAAGHSPLYYAVAHGGEAAAKALLAHGANPDLRQGKNGQGASPLRLATKQGARAMRQLLVPPMEHGALAREVAGPGADGSKARAGRL